MEKRPEKPPPKDNRSKKRKGLTEFPPPDQSEDREKRKNLKNHFVHGEGVQRRGTKKRGTLLPEHPPKSAKGAQEGENRVAEQRGRGKKKTRP